MPTIATQNSSMYEMVSYLSDQFTNGNRATCQRFLERCPPMLAAALAVRVGAALHEKVSFSWTQWLVAVA